uniref:Uncharacterized protein n=1 Tax=Ciona savignyi TaxID=51511 RepID=H2YQV0_CIOSA
MVVCSVAYYSTQLVSTTFEPRTEAAEAAETQFIDPEVGNVVLQVDEESKNPRSPYYGLTYKHTYGFPLSHFNLRSFAKKLTDWRVFFPKLSDALDRFERLNPSHDEQAFTSPTSTEVVLAAGTTYIIGDTFKATIYAKDRQGRPKAFGGDFFRARLIRDKSAGPFTDGIPCVVTDHWNGTYSVSAPLVQAAGFTLEVILVTSLEGISRLVQFTSTRRELGYNYVADLESGEKVRCNVDMSAYPSPYHAHHKRYHPQVPYKTF